MRWSHCYRLEDFALEAPRKAGIYEIGTIRAGTFRPLYLGKASKSIRDRLYAHASRKPEVGNESVHEYLAKQGQGRHHLWVHHMKAPDPTVSEARLLKRHGIGRDGGLYQYNRRYENGQIDGGAN